MKALQLSDQLHTSITLPSSKSICNRMLIIAALSGNRMQLHNLSACDDTRVMQRALTIGEGEVDIMAAGTAMRFLTAYFSATEGEHILTGTARMRQRPIRVLVDALRTLGADIAYTEHEGFPPLCIKGKSLEGGALSLPADISSQYISALLMIAPTLKKGLRLTLEGNIISRPYIDMTLALMRQCGAKAEWTDDATLHILPTGYTPPATFSIESDWSAASYWYELVALNPDASARVELPLLFADSLQGDSRVQHFFAHLGVSTTFTDSGVVLRKAPYAATNEPLCLDLAKQPDLAQTLVVTCAMLRRPFHFVGLQTLKIKETDRIAALQTELRKMGIDVISIDDSELRCDVYPQKPYAELPPPTIATYEDHRMAMAFAPCALRLKAINIEHPEVVSKSYPTFWNDIAKIEQT